MKKQYENPTLRIVSLEDDDIIVTSPTENVGMGDYDPAAPIDAKQRNTIWDE